MPYCAPCIMLILNHLASSLLQVYLALFYGTVNSDISEVEYQVLSWIGLMPLHFKVFALLALHVVFFELTFLTLCPFSSNPVLFLVHYPYCLSC